MQPAHVNERMCLKLNVRHCEMSKERYKEGGFVGIL
jgi:hypothetical protein